MRKVSIRHRVTMYVVIIIGLGLMELFRSRLAHHLRWSTSLMQAGRKVLLFIFIFVIIEVVYAIYRKVKEKSEEAK